jgi:hypothetical protein
VKGELVPTRAYPPLWTCFCYSFPSPYTCTFSLAWQQSCSDLLDLPVGQHDSWLFHSLFSVIIFPKVAFLVIILPKITKVGTVVVLFFFILIPIHLRVGLFQNSEQ